MSSNASPHTSSTTSDRGRTPGSDRLRRIVFALAALIVVVLGGGLLFLAHADGPVGIFAGGPLRSGEPAALADLDWPALDARHDLELEIVGEGRSRTLWFSVFEGKPYVACDLDCVGGVLKRWPQQIERDDRVVVRIDGRRIEGRLVHVPHGTPEYEAARAGRLRKFSGAGGPLDAAETAAHNTVVEVGE
jgi:hypothetical protein